MTRLLTGAVLLAFAVSVVLWANFWIFFAVLVTVACICYREFDVIAARYGFGAPGPLGYGAGLLLLFWEGDAWLVITVVVLVAMTLAMRSVDLAHALPRASMLCLGVVYVFGAWKCALPLREQSPHWLMYSIGLTSAGDIGAYYVGRTFGRHRLAERVSPKKSWEGAAASVVTSVLIAGAYLVHFVPTVSIAAAIGITVVANIAGQLGDLAESAIKRGAGVKDSGTILPGHGGLLDRVDSTLFAMPVVLAYIRIFG